MIERPHLIIYRPSPPAVGMFHHLQVYLRKDREFPDIRFSISPSTLAQGVCRKLRLASDKTTTPGHPAAPLIRIEPWTDNSSPASPMAQPQHSWRSFASTHLAPIKDYLAPRGDPQAPHHHHSHHHHHHHHLFHRHLSSEVGYEDGDAKKHSWSHFASRRFVKRSFSDPEGVTGTERIVLLPGWASRRYHAGPELSNRTGTLPPHSVLGDRYSWFAGAPYDIEVFVSGYVVKHKAPNALSRPQRTLLRLAKS